MTTGVKGSGAARATTRIIKSISSFCSVGVLTPASGYMGATCIYQSTRMNRLWQLLKPRMANYLLKITYPDFPDRARSLGIAPSNYSSLINKMDVDVVHLNWINGEFMSIRDVGGIKKPIIWTLHDMWAFSGVEHIASHPYDFENKTLTGIFDKSLGQLIDRFIWRLKFKSWKKMHIVVPSNWMRDMAQKSRLMASWPITVIPNALDTDIWSPFDKKVARGVLSLPLNKKIVLFSAINLNDSNKGLPSLINAMNKLTGEDNDFLILLLGNGDIDELFCKHEVRIMGEYKDDISMRLVYAAVDVVVVPSKIESFGQVAAEAQACGKPVVGFLTSGLLDVIDHKRSGYMATPGDDDGLCCGISWVLDDPERYRELSNNARQRALKLWSYEVIAEKYKSLYKTVIEFSKNSGIN